ncbi:MAG: M48 family metalloprotease [Candidatus Micrarchaeota archaeon]|nr:M48 family metalloprotease [Candidatus Micrarchaeota archaeon]
MRLALASFFTLALLSGMVFSIIFMFAYSYGVIDVLLLIPLTVLVNILLWLFSPSLADIIYRTFYNVRWISLAELGEKSPRAADLIKSVCVRYGFNTPRLGIIPDKNPNAFTYGSGRWNARIIVTEGIFEYLDENEIASVYAHELGHIKNRDFIIMTLASVFLQLLYEFYYIFGKSSSGSKKRKGGLAGLAALSYLFFLIGQFLVLFLSRVREYYADKFAAEHTDPNFLASALIKISYGILANPDNTRLVESTKFIGITNFKDAKNVGIVYYNCEKIGNFEPLLKTMLFDIYSPWAFVTELSSTHPLTGKRIKRLCEASPQPMFDFEAMKRKYEISKTRMWGRFVMDFLGSNSYLVVFPVYILAYFYVNNFNITRILSAFEGFIAGCLLVFGATLFISTLYRYPSTKHAKRSSVIELMGDMYASPVRGKSVELRGKLVGRGIPGYIFSEDLMMQDETGLIYLNYESWLLLPGNVSFALRKVKELIGKTIVVRGWFLRGITQQVVIDRIEVEETGERIRGYAKKLSLVFSAVMFYIGILMAAVV